MKTWAEIEHLLTQEIPPALIKPADPSKGIYGEWLKGQSVLSMANEVFGAGGWSTAIVTPPNVTEVTIAVTKEGEPRKGIIVFTTVEVTAYGLDEDGEIRTQSKQDIGWGTAVQSWDRQHNRYLPLKPAQYRAAVQGSVTIGLKRALHQFGRFLGMELYLPDEDQMAIWGPDEEEEAEGAPKKAPTKKKAASKPKTAEGAGQTALAVLAGEIGVEVTPANTALFKCLAERKAEVEKWGPKPVKTKKVQETLGAEATVEMVFREMPGYAAWMCQTVLEGDKRFLAAQKYAQAAIQSLHLIYELQGGDYEPWEGVGVKNPTIMVWAQIEKKALEQLDDALTSRFPNESGEGVNPYHLRNHLKAHFRVERLALATWEQLAAFRVHILEGAEYPQQWRKHEAEEEEKAEEPAEEEKAEEPQAPPTEDIREQCFALLEEMDEKLGVELAKPFTAMASKYPLDQPAALYIVAGVHKSVMSGGLQSQESTEALLTTALKGLQ